MEYPHALWFHDRSTLAKLLGTFAVLCLVMGGVGYLGLTTAQTIMGHLDEATGNLLPSAIAVAGMNNALGSARINVRSATLATDQKETDQFVAQATAAVTEAEKREALFKGFPLEIRWTRGSWPITTRSTRNGRYFSRAH